MPHLSTVLPKQVTLFAKPELSTAYHKYGVVFTATVPALVAPASVPVCFLVGRASLPAINFAGRDACATEPVAATGTLPRVYGYTRPCLRNLNLVTPSTCIARSRYPQLTV